MRIKSTHQVKNMKLVTTAAVGLAMLSVAGLASAQRYGYRGGYYGHRNDHVSVQLGPIHVDLGGHTRRSLGYSDYRSYGSSYYDPYYDRRYDYGRYDGYNDCRPSRHRHGW